MAVKKKNPVLERMKKKGESYNKARKAIGRRKSAGGSGG